jgi:hypothetical protein
MTITLTREEAQQVLGALEEVTDGAEEPHKTKEAIETLRARLAQPEPKPVAWITDREGLYFDKQDAFRDSDGFIKPLFLAPLPRKWQGLTDEEVDEAAKERWVAKQSFEAGASWANERLKDKNT